jgi:hypothetical protein
MDPDFLCKSFTPILRYFYANFFVIFFLIKKQYRVDISNFTGNVTGSVLCSEMKFFLHPFGNIPVFARFFYATGNAGNNPIDIIFCTKSKPKKS